jgi:hemerythrin-like domain-containing protein
MKRDITKALVNEHKLIVRMLAVLERNALRTSRGEYCDYRFHHAKEEDILFEALVNNGMPSANSPVAAMLMEHDQGRAYVRAMEEAAKAALAGTTGQDAAIALNAVSYLELLREHIAKEDDILYPLAERLIPEEMRDGIIAGYAAAEGRSAVGFEKRYEEVVARCEAEALEQAA